MVFAAPDIVDAVTQSPAICQKRSWLGGAATDGDEMRACNTALEDWLDADDVKNPSRVLRLAGTVNYAVCLDEMLK